MLNHRKDSEIGKDIHYTGSEIEMKLRDEINILHAQVCSGLADPNRILILYELSDGPHNVSDLAPKSPINWRSRFLPPFPAVSEQIRSTLRPKDRFADRSDRQQVLPVWFCWFVIVNQRQTVDRRSKTVMNRTDCHFSVRHGPSNAKCEQID